MNILQGDRGLGKTARMIAWFVENPVHRGIIVPNHQQRLHVIKEVVKFFPHMTQAKIIYPHNYKWEEHIFTPLTVLQRRRGRDIQEMWFDNFDMFLRDVVGGGPITLTTSEEVEVDYL